ncbi:fatty acid desaturase [Sphaerisporangium sp. NPDC049002]|uniref:fatty acid desaturase n=1 Tax=unclassified Sphaerisporangium TaxID=2630420 RepID=UPI003409DC16
MPAEVTVADIGMVRPSTLVDTSGRRYVDFRRTLRPRWGVVWGTLLAGHLGLALSAVAVAWLGSTAAGRLPTAIAPAVAGGLAIGFCLHYLTTYLHEGAHYNLAPARRASDVLTNIFVGSLVGMDVKAYRKVHFDHHRYLGTTRDPERSYFLPLDSRFLLEGVTGVRLVRALKEYRELMRSKSPTAETGRTASFGPVFLAACLVNGSIVGCALWRGAFALAVSWVLGQLVFLPLINTVRQVLEHRSEFADDSTDYRRVAHGPVNRLFGGGPFATVFGSAGFNRHLLHHWDPSVSFTRLGEVERFLMGTEIAPLLRQRQTTYYRAWRQLDRI